MSMLALKKKKNNSRKGGFTMVELLVSLVIFSIISVLMTSIVLSMAKFSLDSERRNDMLAEIDTASGSIKNELRAAQTIGTCGSDLYIKSNDATAPFKKLERVKMSDGNYQLRWIKVDNETCSNPATSSTTDVTSSRTINVLEYRLAKTDAVGSNGTAKNTLLYVYLVTCDPNNEYQIFNCETNPYTHVFAISTRNVEVL